jgi:hypothetical protein
MARDSDHRGGLEDNKSTQVEVLKEYCAQPAANVSALAGAHLDVRQARARS